jgi:hypothetical protein
VNLNAILFYDEIVGFQLVDERGLELLPH